MKVNNNWLVSESNSEIINIKKSPNVRNNIIPKFLVIHYTAGDSAENAVNWFMTPFDKGNPNRIAAHIVVDVDGSITQLVPFNCRANHAGYSVWDKITGFNLHAIGIEIVNPGYLEKMPDDSYRRVIGKEKNGTKIYKLYPKSISATIFVGDHKHKLWNEADNHHWFKYPKAQLEAVYKLSKVLMNHYQLINALGHDDISPIRKPDPGPAFPWDEFKMHIFGRTDNVGKIFVVTAENTNFRDRPSFESIKMKKLKIGYEVGLIETNGLWNKVYLVNDRKDVINPDDSCKKEIGWIHSSVLRLK
jgi:N-acetylmuramoyl-L-alanine amidase